MPKRRRATGAARPAAEPRSRAPSQRQLRVGELLRQALGDVFAREEIREPTLAAHPPTVTEVRMSPDLRQATCFVVPLGGEQGDGSLVPALNRLAPWLASQVARRVRLRFAPRLSFRLDESFDEAARIDALLRRPDVARDLGEGAPPKDEDLEQGDEDGETPARSRR